MATKAETNAVYAAGLIQGIALVTFPAASTIFTNPSQYGLSNTQYGTMFLPQVVTAITASLLGGKLAQRFGTKRVFLASLVADLAGYGIAAFGTGPLLDAGVSLHDLFGFAAVAAVIMGGLSFTLARKSSAKVVAPAPTA